MLSQTDKLGGSLHGKWGTASEIEVDFTHGHVDFLNGSTQMSNLHEKTEICLLSLCLLCGRWLQGCTVLDAYSR